VTLHDKVRSRGIRKPFECRDSSMNGDVLTMTVSPRNRMPREILS